MKRRTCLLAFGSILALASAQPVFAQSASAPAQARSVNVALQVMHTLRSGGVVLGGTASDSLAPGKATSDSGDTLVAFAGETACSAGVGAGKLSPEDVEKMPTPPVRHWWTVDVRLVSATTDNIAMDITLVHQLRDANGAMHETSRDVRSVKLAENEPHLLAFVDGRPGDTSCNNANSFFQISASITPDAHAQQLLNYNLWLVQKDAQGAQTSQRSQLTTHSGEQASIHFDQVAWQADRSACDLRLNVSATIRGRERDDGRFDVGLMLNVKPTANTGGGYGGGSGRKLLTAAADEPLEFTLPELPAFLKSRCAGPGPSMILTVKAR
jgi:hypothetical protein